MVSTVAFCPSPPLLVPELAAGAAGELDALRAACREAVRRLLAARPDEVIVIGTGSGGGRFPPGTTGTLAGYGVPVTATLPGGPPRPGPLPLPLTLGAWLLTGADVPCRGVAVEGDAAGATAPRAVPVDADAPGAGVPRPGVAVTGDAPGAGVRVPVDGDAPDAGVRVPVDGDAPDAGVPRPGVAVDGDAPGAGVGVAVDGDAAALPDAPAYLVVGDGSARRTERSPGYVDPRAEPFDAAVAAALADGDAGALRDLDAALGADLLAAGVPAWRAVGHALAGRRYDADLLYAGAPYGVGYFVAVWERR